MYQRILLATDGSELSQRATTSAIELAALCGAELVAVTVIPRYPQSYFEGSVALPVDEMLQIEKQWENKGQALVDTVKKAAADQGVKAQSTTLKSDVVSDALISAANKHQCDLIVMASHGRKGIQRLLLGSETQHVLAHTTIPVLVIR